MPQLRFIGQMLYGLQAAKDIKYYAITDGLATRFRRFGKWHGRVQDDESISGSPQLDLPLFDSG